MCSCWAAERSTRTSDVILELARELDEAGIDIVVVGALSSIFSTNSPTSSGSNIHHAGYVGDDDLAALYGGALCLVFPSRTEGFGIPPLEAMAMGCPVICSNAASLMEVGGDAVAYIDPDRATAGEKPSWVYRQMTIFAQPWRHKGERERPCSPGSAARNCTWMKSCVCREAIDETGRDYAECYQSKSCGAASRLRGRRFRGPPWNGDIRRGKGQQSGVQRPGRGHCRAHCPRAPEAPTGLSRASGTAEAKRDRCRMAIAVCVEDGQRQFDVSD